jgi:tRNA(Ile)-lysidine synthase
MSKSTRHFCSPKNVSPAAIFDQIDAFLSTQLAHLPFKLVNHQLKCQQPIILSFSGGPDSMFLFHYLQNRLVNNQQLHIIYFNHQLRSTSNQEKNFVTAFLKKHPFAHTIKNLPTQTFAQKHHVSLETAGRFLRQSFLLHYAKLYQTNYILTAHHKDDFIETFFLRLLRGAQANLGSFSLSQSIYHKTFLKPLLAISKSQILSYLQQHQIPYIEDETNNDTTFKRNHLRRAIIPQFSKINPSYQNNLNSAITYLHHQKDFCKQALQSELAKINTTSQDLVYPLTNFLSLPVFLQKNLLLELLTIFQQYPPHSSTPSRLLKPTFDLSTQHINNILALIQRAQKQPSSKSRALDLGHNYLCQVTNQNLTLRRQLTSKKNLIFSYQITSIPSQQFIPALDKTITFSLQKYQTKKYLSTQNIAYLNYDKLAHHSIIIRNRQPGDSFQPFGSHFQKKIKKYFIDKKIPANLRPQIPLFFCNDTLIWIGGFQISELFKITNKTKKVLKIAIK